jgi:hypothetical protein
MKFFATIALSATLIFAGCAFLEKPNTQAAATSLGNAVASYVSGNNFGTIVDTLTAGADLLRELQATPAAAKPAATKSALVTGGAGTIAPQVAAAITSLVGNGVSPDAANETVAKVLDAAVAIKQASLTQ